MPAWITHIGHAVPGTPISQEALVEWLVPRLAPGASPERLRHLARRSGVATRYSVLDLFGAEGEAMFPIGRPVADTGVRTAAFVRHAGPLAAAAVVTLGIDLARVTHLVAVTCTGAVAPGLDLDLVTRLSLPPATRRTQIGFMGCHAAIPALRLARDTVLADSRARVLVVCCELSSLHLTPGPDDDLLVGGLLFGDGAAALLVTGEPSGCALALANDATMVVADSADQMAWTASAAGFHLRLSPRVPQSLSAVLPALAHTLLGEVPADRVRWIIHPGGPRIITAAEQALGLPAGAGDASRAALASAGNRSSGTVLAILADSLAQPWTGPAVLTAFGPGLTAEAIRVDRN